MQAPQTPTRRAGLARLAEPVVSFPLLAIILLGVVWGTTLHVIGVEREVANASASASSLEHIDTYEAQVLRALREIDQTLKFVKYTQEATAQRVDLAKLRDKGLLPPPLLFGVSITDVDGRVVASSRAGELQDVGDTDFFEAARASDTVAVGRPRTTRDIEAQLHFARRIDGADGRFAGIVMVSVIATYFVAGYEPARLGQNGFLGILGTDGVFRVRRTGETTASGEVTDYRALVRTSQSDATPPTRPMVSWDGVRRYTVTRELFDYPVAVVVGLSLDEQMAAVDARARSYAGRALGASVLLLLFVGGLGLLSYRLAQTRSRANRALQDEIAVRRQAEAALQLRHRAVESSVNAILIFDLARPGMPIEYVNPAFERITGYRADEVRGRDGTFLLGQDREQAGVREIEHAMREHREGHAVLRNYRKDGTLFWNEYYIAPVRDEAGMVRHYVGVMNDVTEAKRYEQQLARQANFDGLTGLANRNLLKDRLTQALAGARRDQGSVAVIFLDVDNFKEVNDSLGHTVGDGLLCAIAMRLHGAVRETDTVARHGGDEFVLVLNARHEEDGAFERDATALVQKILEQVSGPLEVQGHALRPTCSIGVAIFPQDGMDADMLLRNADAAMYRAKELGRNRFQFFTSDVHERVRRRMELATSLREALERDEFELHYQPQVGVVRGGIQGVEALLRWRHPERGLISPGLFVPFAEETGLIVPIGEWVLREACRQNKAWQDAGLPRIPIAVNMSARQCEQDNVTAVVRSALRDSGLDARWLELELTESLSMAHPDQSVPMMQRLKDIGVSLSIDDFGTGFSNLSYLRRFPIDRLKIDLSFVREITRDAGSLAISEAIINMSHQLNLEVVAEGVEEHAQLSLLGDRKCDMIQGYLYSAPVPAEQFARLLREDRRLAYVPTRKVDAPAMAE
jgi:diguanylate cyclase (GGDEF)-like protein/PAS domain S-box-containing protein